MKILSCAAWFCCQVAASAPPAAATPAPSTSTTGLPQPLANADAASGKLRVVTYNILGGRNPDGKRDFSRIATVLKILNPDIVALQEVDVGTKRLQGRNLPAELEKLTGWKAFFAAAMPHDGGEYGEAALAKLPTEVIRKHPLPCSAGHEPRTALELECAMPNGSKFRFFATHLDHEDDDKNRQMQAAKLMEILSAQKDSPPALLAGDLNAEPSAASIKRLLAGWNDTWPEGKIAPTWPADKPSLRIDYVLMRKGDGWKVTRLLRGDEVFPGNAAWHKLLLQTSDHLPVVAELEFPTGTK
jgi:endonuclease/exonuclease/phosphatase family metal-dependent hydrolase